MRPSVVSKTGVGQTAVVPVDYLQSRFAVSAAGVVNGTVTFNIEHTYDDVLNPAVTPTWFAPAADSGKTANHDKGFTSPVRGIRGNVTAGTGTLTLTVLQGDPR